MIIKPKKFVYFVKREPHWLSNRYGYFTMERNERVDEFPKKFMKKLKNEINSFYLRTYTDTHLIYDEVAKWLKVKKSIGHIGDKPLVIGISCSGNSKNIVSPPDAVFVAFKLTVISNVLISTTLLTI